MKNKNEWLNERAKNACEDCGLVYGEHYTKLAGGGYRFNHGNVMLVKETSGWELQQLCENSTGIRFISGSSNAMTFSEMTEFLGGMMAAARLLKKDK
ncbi:MAG: hypothetical protein P4L79_10220 [Legionella sp.]|uniref:hypothetical protein n=1 Tax=Legionella sp. TaxID=459 RepID=UPI0028439662|nr:hypothetical protein [Legionella sp.]